MDTPDAGRNYRPLGFSMLAASILLTVGLNLWSVPAAFTVAVRFFIVVLGASSVGGVDESRPGAL